MPEFDSGFTEGNAGESYPGSTPPAPQRTAPATALAAGAPALGLGLANVIIIVSGDVNVTSTFPSSTVQRR